MKTYFIISALLFMAVSANSQGLKHKLFSDVYNPIKTKNRINCDTTQKINERVLYEYGAVYISNGATLPKRCIFDDETKINAFKSAANISCFATFGNGKFCLQRKAKTSLEKVFASFGGYYSIARNCNSTTSCTNDLNDDWAFRTYEQTKCNWLNLASDLELCEQTQLDVKMIEEEIKDDASFPKMFKVAIPGSSQHNIGLAIDVNNRTGTNEPSKICGDACVEKLEENGWFRTVKYDAFHYTYLGFTKSQLPSKGLKKVQCEDTFTYWVPNAPKYVGYKNWECKDVK